MGGMELWECPDKTIPLRIWQALDIFWLCHIKMSGMNGWVIQRQCWPTNDSPLEQDAWLVWAFDVFTSAFYELQHLAMAEQTHADTLKQAHDKVHAVAKRG
jgi:hypothetical protein